MTSGNGGCIVLASNKPGELPVDPNVKVPTDVQDNIAKGEALAKNQKKRRSSKRDSILKGSRAGPIFRTAVVDQEVQDRRESALEKKARLSQGKRGQPPMLERLRVGTIIVERLLADGVPWATSRNSRMNKLLRERLNGLAANSRDTRKSRCKEVSADAVRDLLREIKGLDD
jgi:hypothetical protein